MRTLTVFLLAAAMLLAALWLFQRRLMYFPHSALLDSDRALPGLQRVAIAQRDGPTLGAWFVPAPPPHPARAALLVLNGNAGNRSYRAPLAAALAREGLAVLLFDYRGYGGNAGRPTEPGLLADARAARAWLEARVAASGTSTVLFGESLGSALAVALAAERAPAALVLRSPFTSMVDVARHHYPWLPVAVLLADRYDAISRIARVACPVLVVAGDRDGIVPLSLSERLYEAAPQPKRLVVVPGADHNDEELTWGEPLVREIVRLVGELGPTSGHAPGWRAGPGR